MANVSKKIDSYKGDPLEFGYNPFTKTVQRIVNSNRRAETTSSFTVSEHGELLEGSVVRYVKAKVDNQPYSKVYPTLFVFLSRLSPPAILWFKYLSKNMVKNLNVVRINYKEAYDYCGFFSETVAKMGDKYVEQSEEAITRKAKRAMSNGFAELIKNNVLKPTELNGYYWFNPYLMFNGKRTMIPIMDKNYFNKINNNG
jgi:hypothetical protein